MFDYVTVEVDLPDNFKSDNFQTKDFFNQMVTHRITKDGKFKLSTIKETNVIPKEQRPYPDGPGILGLIGSVETVTVEHDFLYTGVFNFYAIDKDKKLHDYYATFDKGSLVKITLKE